MGGAAVLMTEMARAGAFARILAFEPIIFPLDRGLERENIANDLALMTLKRKRRFASLTAARDNFRGRGIFAHWHPDALDAYVRGGLMRDRSPPLPHASDHGKHHDLLANNTTPHHSHSGGSTSSSGRSSSESNSAHRPTHPDPWAAAESIVQRTLGARGTRLTAESPPSAPFLTDASASSLHRLARPASWAVGDDLAPAATEMAVDREELALACGEHGTRAVSQEAVVLRCRPEWESGIYGGWHRAWDTLARVRCPVRVVSGEHTDTLRNFGEPLEVFESVHKRLPRSTFEVLPRVGHLMVMERPDLTARLVMEEIDQLP